MHYHGHRERLRKKFRANPESFEDYEILELLLAQVITRKNTKPLAKELLERFQSIQGVLDAKPAELLNVPDFGEALLSYWQLLREIMLRYEKSNIREHVLVKESSSIAKLARLQLASTPHEEIWVAYLDTQNRLISWEQCNKGSVDMSIIYPRDILERALILKSSAFILVHNHPGGSCKPSGADLKLTASLKQAAETLNLRFLDHLIVTDVTHYSVLDDGLL